MGGPRSTVMDGHGFGFGQESFRSVHHEAPIGLQIRQAGALAGCSVRSSAEMRAIRQQTWHIRTRMVTMTKKKVRVQVRRAYDAPERGDGTRVLVDRLWPRGLAKAKADLDEWCKEVAPSTELRKWSGRTDPVLTVGLRKQLARHDSLIPKSAAICFRVVFGPRRRKRPPRRHPGTPSDRAWACGHLPAVPLGTTDQVSPGRERPVVTPQPNRACGLIGLLSLESSAGGQAALPPTCGRSRNSWRRDD